MRTARAWICRWRRGSRRGLSTCRPVRSGGYAMPLRILAVTGGRADWGLLSPVLAALRDDAAFDLRIAATGQHLMAAAGGSLQRIAEEGFAVDETVDMGLGAGDDAAAVTRAMGRGV